MKNYVLLLLLMMSTLITNAQKIGHLDTLSQPKRDSILLSLSKKAILRYGPDYYEINRPPKIERRVRPEGGRYAAGRIYYKISYFYDDEFYKKRPDGGNLVEVYIFEDAAFVSDIMFEDNGIAFIEGEKEGFIKDGKRMMTRFIRSATTRYVYIDYIPNEDE